MFKEFNNFIPYVGARVKKVYLVRKIAGSNDTVRMKSETEFGAVLGLDYKIDDDIIINVEARGDDEGAYTFGVSYLF